jgi:MFS family permease
VPRRAAYALIAFGITALIFGTTVPLGLYQSYAERYHFSDAVLTFIASVSVIGVVTSVVFTGRLSDRFGRRVVMLPALLVGAVALVLLLVAQGTELLIVGRLLSGFSVGAFTGAATAALTELHPSGDSTRAARLAAAAAVVGFASGTLVSGYFVQYGPWPFRLVYVVSLALLVPTIVTVALMDETVKTRSTGSIRPQRLRIPSPGGRTFALASLLSLCAWGLACMFQSLGPSIVIRLLGVGNRAVATTLVAGFLTSSAVAQLRLRRWPVRRATLTGLVLLPTGSTLVIVSVLTQSVAAFLAGVVVAGLGQGLTYLGGQSLVESVAPPAQRGEVFSAYVIVVYMTSACPAMILGLVARTVGLRDATIGYTALLATLATTTALVCLRALRHAPRPPVEPLVPAA